MFLAKLAVRRPVLTTMFILMFVVVGYNSYTRLSQELMPNIDFPFVLVQTIYPGAGPKEVESQITKLIEDEAFSISNLDEMQSWSREGYSLIFMQFELGENADLKAIEVKDKIEQIIADLPEDAEQPAVFKYEPTASPVMRLAVTSPRGLEETYRLTDQRIKDELAKVDGVSSVQIIGGLEREIRVAARRDDLRAYGLSVADILQAVISENVNFPAGHIITGDQEISLRLQGKYQSPEQIERIRLNTPSGKSIFLKDVARVIDTNVEQRTKARFQGVETVSLEIRKKSGANAVAISDGTQGQIEELKKILPADVKIEIVQDSSDFIRDSVKDAVSSIIIGVLLTALLLWVFLHDIRSTFIAAVSIPAAVVATFLPMLFSGFTINVISLMGLGVSVGTLVANSIVVLESIIVYLDKGYPPDEAAIQGTGSVAIAVIASMGTNLVVFTPIAFMKGIVGQIFLQFGLTVVYATIFSLVMSFTLVPMLAVVMYRSGGKKHEFFLVRLFANAWNKGYDGLALSYKKQITWGLRHRWAVALFSVLAFAGGIMLFGFIGNDFFPESDENFLSVTMKLPAGTSLSKTDEMLQEMDTKIQKEYGKYIVSSLHGIGGEMAGVEEGSISYNLVDKTERDLSAKQLTARIRPLLASIPGAEITVGVESHGPGSGMQLDISGPDLDQINRYADKMMDLMRQVGTLVDIRKSYVPGKPELTFVPDREQMAAYGVSTAMVGSLLRLHFEGEVETRYKELDEEYDIRVQLDEAERQSYSDFTDLFLHLGPQDIPLTQLGEIKFTTAETEIQHMDKQRRVTVSANMASKTLGENQEALQELIDKDIDIQPGYKILFSGQSEFMAETMGYIIDALILAIILTYMVLAATLESFIHPFTIMITLPLGLIGVAMALFLSGISINMMSLMAIVMLVGVVVNNAILILDYTEQLRQQGMSIREALVEASYVRLRPILMMNLAIAISLAPSVMGSGAEYREAIAMVTIGGVLVSTVFTLYLIPVIYTFFDKLSIKKRKIVEKA